MKAPRADNLDPLPPAAVAVAAVLCTVWVQELAFFENELYSEIICWLLVPALFWLRRRWVPESTPYLPLSSAEATKTHVKVVSSLSLWVVAGCLAMATWFKAETNIVVILFPVVIPLLLFARTVITRTSPDVWIPPYIRSPITLAVLIAVGVVYPLYHTEPIKSALSVTPTATLFVVYFALEHGNSEHRFRWLLGIDIDTSIVALSWRMVVVMCGALAFESRMFGLPSVNLVPMVLLGIAKALSWHFTIQTARHTSWIVGAAIASFSIIATRDPFSQTEGLQATEQVLAAGASLAQLVALLPRQMKGKQYVWALFLVPLAPFMVDLHSIRSMEVNAPASFRTSALDHPIEALSRVGYQKLEHLMSRQSTNYTRAETEYRRRYGIEPPPGFEEWYEFAVKHQSVVIDDFDTMYRTLFPFWKLSGAQVNRAMTDVVADQEHLPIWDCSFVGSEATTHCSHPYLGTDRSFTQTLTEQLKDLKGALPDVRMLINNLDEPMVVFPEGGNAQAILPGGKVHMTNYGKQSVWTPVTKHCRDYPRTDIPPPATNETVETFGMPFVTDVKAKMDLCRHPEYSEQHGLIMSPNSFWVIDGAVPVMSPATHSTMGDVLYPAAAYMEGNFVYDDHNDADWDKKRNKVFWAGITTGGYANDHRWHGFHRHRWVQYGQSLLGRTYAYLRETSKGVVKPVLSSFLNGRLYNVGFTQLRDCEARQCRDENAFYRFKERTPSDEPLKYKLVFDLDGNGLSGRYYRLLASKSCVLKQTLLQEWHDDRLVPWVHYAPVSQGMDELAEMVFYLTSTPKGQERAKRIADAGREWSKMALRQVDFAIYNYRLILELARIQDPERQPLVT